MNRTAPTFFAVIPLVLLVTVTTSSAQQPRQIDREVLVKFRPGTLSRWNAEEGGLFPALSLPAELRTLLEKAAVERLVRALPNFAKQDTLRILADGREFRQPDWSTLMLVRVPEPADPDQLISQLNKLPWIEYAERNVVSISRELRGPEIVPVDGDFHYQWNMKNTALYGGSAQSDVKATHAWYRTTGTSTGRFGIIDTGVQLGHPEFGGRVQGSGVSPDDHGSAVAGVAAAAGNNGSTGIAGVNWNTQIFSRYKGSAEQIVQAFSDLILYHDAEVINCSWGLNQYSETVRAAMLSAHAADVLVVIANPQTNSPIPFPNDFGSFLVNVGASDWNDAPTSYTLTSYFTDLAAPGGDGYGYGRIRTLNDQSGYSWRRGTSFAAPHVSGSLGLLKAIEPSLTNYDIEAILKKSTEVQGLYQITQYGVGRLDIDSALGRIESPYEILRGNAQLTQVLDNSLVYFASSPDGWRGSNYSLSFGYYFVDAYKLQATTVFPVEYTEVPWAWLSQTGYPPGNDPAAYNYAHVQESITTTGMTLTTYFYWIDKTLSGETVGRWVPFDPFYFPKKYTVLGIPSGPPPPPPPPPPVLPSAPTGLEGVYFPPGHGGPKVHLTWNRNPLEENVDRYWVEYAIEEEEFSVVEKSVPDPGSGTEVEYDHWCYEVEGAEYLRYRVRAHNPQGYGPFCTPTEVPLGIEPLSASEENSLIEPMPTELVLDSNYPNPFNPITQIRFGLSEHSHVRLQVLNTRGQHVRTILDEDRPMGWHTVMWDGKDAYGQDAASGIYFYVLEAQGMRLLKKMVLVR